MLTRKEALAVADELIAAIQLEAGDLTARSRHYAPDLRDSLEDHKSWVREIIALHVQIGEVEGETNGEA